MDDQTKIAITIPGHGEFVFGATPTFQADYEDFQNKYAKSRLISHVREFCRRALLEPAGEAGLERLDAAFQRFPATAPTIVAELEKLAGSEIEVSVRKK